MFAKNKLASAVAAAIGVSAVGVAQADTVFFPYVALSQTVTTIISVINTSQNIWTSAGVALNAREGHLHYRLYYKSGDKVDKLDANCEEYNDYLPTSVNDLQTIDLGGVFGADTAGVLFNDPSVYNKWKQSARDYAIGRYIAPARGYLTIDNSDTAGGTLSGEAFIFEFGNGAAWGYQAYASLPNRPSDFRHAASRSPTDVAIMPLSEVSTAFFVTPVSQDQTPASVNSYRAKLALTVDSAGNIYNRDEVLLSGTQDVTVVCVGRVNATSLMSDALQKRLKDGGWSRVWSYRVDKDGNPTNFAKTPAGYVAASYAAYNTVGTTAGDSLVKVDPAALYALKRDPVTGQLVSQVDAGAVVIKLEYNLGETLNGESVVGVFNNGVLLRP